MNADEFIVHARNGWPLEGTELEKLMGRCFGVAFNQLRAMEDDALGERTRADIADAIMTIYKLIREFQATQVKP